MKKFEADRLEEAYDAACREFGCSITELEYEIVQYPTNGVLGLFAKKAIIVADKKKTDIKSTEIVEVVKEKIVEEPEAEQSTDDIQPVQPKTAELVESENGKNDKKISNTEGNKPDTSDSEKENEVLESFFTDSSETETTYSETEKDSGATSLNSIETAKEIEDHIKNLIKSLCFDIDTVEVDVEGNIAYIFMDGEDAALLIGKEGYRYNALSYLLFNWINVNYNLYIKLEIARFLQSQEEMIKNYIQPVVEHVEKEGWGRTRPLDGILAQIALGQLRERFPNKYVAIKKNRVDDRRYIVINDFIKYN